MDLYYRLNVAMIELPPLRERREGIPLLAGYFLDDYGRRSRRGAAEIGADAMEVLMHHDWPGNVRELRNAVEYASVQAQNDVLRASDLPSLLNGGGTEKPFSERRRGDRRRRMPEDPPLKKSGYRGALRRAGWAYPRAPARGKSMACRAYRSLSGRASHDALAPYAAPGSYQGRSDSCGCSCNVVLQPTRANARQARQLPRVVHYNILITKDKF
jgi:DNA-binding NtrC family response regulator